MSRRADMFVDLEDDPREGGPTVGDERAVLVDFLRCQRLTLELNGHADLLRERIDGRLGR